MIKRIESGIMPDMGLKLELTTEDDLARMATDWGEWASRDDATLSMVHTEIIIQK